MHDDRPDEPPSAATRADARRERFRRMQAVAAQMARARAAGGSLGENEAVRLVAEFHARGGRVTVCAPAENEPPGTERSGGEPGKRAGA